MLIDRARIQLSDAGIPVLQSTDEAEMTGRPRLVFNITLNKETATAPAVLVESMLYERVRLWRDPAKEKELATWVQSGAGYPKVTSQMLFDVFDGQVKQFVKAYRAVNPKQHEAENRTPDPAAQLQDDVNTLQGLNGTSVFVSIRRNILDESNGREEVLEKLFQMEAETKFEQAGIRVFKYANESEAAGRPLLYVFIKLSQPNSHAPTIEIESNFWQQVRPVRELKKEILAVTWESEAIDNGPTVQDAVRQVMNRQLDEFIRAYQTANQ